MSDKLISSLQEKPILADTDMIVIEGGGATWKSTIAKFKEFIFGFFAITSTTQASDYVILKKITGEVYKVSLDNLLPVGVVKTAMLADSTSATSGIIESKLAPGSVTHPKLAIDAVHTHNIHDAEIVTPATYGTDNFGTGVTTRKIVDGAVTGPKGGVPVGAVFHFTALSAPAGYLIANGDIISADASQFTQLVPNWKLKELRDIVSTSFGVEGSLPDLRGLFIRGYGGDSGEVGGNKKTYRHLITPHQFPNITGAAAGISPGIAWTADSKALSYIVVYSQDPRFQGAIYERGTTASVRNVVISGLTGVWYFRVYSLRPLVSGNFGAAQDDSTKLHFHYTHDPQHTHTATTTVSEGKDGHKHGLSINIGGTSSGGLNMLRPWDSKSEGRFNGSTEFAKANISVSVVNTAASTGLAVRDSPLDPLTPVDETRPLNLALLPCIKY